MKNIFFIVLFCCFFGVANSSEDSPTKADEHEVQQEEVDKEKAKQEKIKKNKKKAKCRSNSRSVGSRIKKRC